MISSRLMAGGTVFCKEMEARSLSESMATAICFTAVFWQESLEIEDSTIKWKFENGGILGAARWLEFNFEVAVKIGWMQKLKTNRYSTLIIKIIMEAQR